MRATISNKETKATLNEHGASMLEYVMMVSLIALACLAGVTSVGNSSKQTFEKISNVIHIEAGDIDP